MDAIVVAGGETEPKHALYPFTHGGPKSMIPIAGKPMVQWVLDAFSQSSDIEHVIVVGLPPETDLECEHRLTLLPDAGAMVTNIQSAVQEILQNAPNATHALVASGDIPGLRGEIVDWLICQVKDLDQDIYYTIIERETMESYFPKAKSSYAHFKDAQVCGGNLHCLRLQSVTEETPLLKQIIEVGKSPFRQASIIGYDTLFFLMLRQLTLKDAQATVCKRLGIKGRALISPYPEIGMDVDKPSRLENLREYLSKHHERHTPSAE